MAQNPNSDEIWSTEDEDEDRASLEYDYDLESWVIRVTVKHGTPSGGHVVCLEMEDLESLLVKLTEEIEGYRGKARDEK